MTKTQNIFIKLLSAAILNEKIHNELTDVNWNEIYNISVEHQLFALLYPVAKEFEGSINSPEKELLEVWKQNTLRAALIEAGRIKEFENVITAFDKEDIRILALKGLVVRDFYPNPEFRIMGDSDILVSEKQVRASKRILKDLGYKAINTTNTCTTYENKDMRIDLHTRIMNNVVTDQVEKWENGVWDKIIPVKIGYAQTYTLSVEDHLVFICLHMAEHFVSAGFGLRQLCDLVLYVKANNANINWDDFKNTIETMNMGIFIKVLFSLCNSLFRLEMPLFSEVILGEKQTNLMIENIFNGGVFGKNITQNVVSGYYLNNLRGRSRKALPNRFVRFIYLLFPPYRIMKYKYRYVRRIPFLLPFSWIHRIIYNIFRKDKVVSSKEGINSLLNHNVCEERYELLQWLKLI